MKRKPFYLPIIVFLGFFCLYLPVFANEAEENSVKNEIQPILKEDKISADDPKKRIKIRTDSKPNRMPLHDGMRLFDRLDPFKGETKESGYWNLAWHARLADYGSTDSQYIVATAYEKGIHTSKNKVKALYFYKMAAQKGHEASAFRLGQIFENGLLGETDLEQALFWYDLAGSHESVSALLAASKLCREREIPDYEKSYYYLWRAMEILFPNETNLEEKAPELITLKNKIIPNKFERAKLEHDRQIAPLLKRIALLSEAIKTSEETLNQLYADIHSDVLSATNIFPELIFFKTRKTDNHSSFQRPKDPISFLTERLIKESEKEGALNDS